MGTSSTTQLSQILVKHWRCSGWTKFVRTTTCWLLVGKTVRGSSFGTWMGKEYRIGNACLFIGNTDCSCRFLWMTSEWLEERRIWLPVWKKLMKLADLGEPTSFLDRVFVWCTQRECNPYGIIIKEHKETLDHEFLQQQMKNFQGGRNLTQKRSRGPTTWKDMRQNALSNRRWFQKARLGNGWRTVQCVFSNCFEVLIFGTNWKTDILWSVNKLARAVT